jgi:hypothetical protein
MVVFGLLFVTKCFMTWPTSMVDSTFARWLRELSNANVASMTTLESDICQGPLVLTFVNDLPQYGTNVRTGTLVSSR